MNYPSIFNDVIGPVMRGPSSSHCAASLRIGRICHDLMDGRISDIEIDFDPEGSLATTHKDQGSDMGLFGGFLGWEAYDERLVDSEIHLGGAGIKATITIKELKEKHPNTYQITLHNPWETHQVIAISTGGGMIEVLEIDGVKVSLAGDCFLTLVYSSDTQKLDAYLREASLPDDLEIHANDKGILILKSQAFLDVAYLEEFKAIEGVISVKQIKPVLPVLTRKNTSVPFITCDEMFSYNEGKNLSLWQLAARYESMRGNISRAEVFEKMRSIVQIMQNSIDLGLKGTKYADRILGPQSLGFQKQLEDKKLVELHTSRHSPSVQAELTGK